MCYSEFIHPECEVTLRKLECLTSFDSVDGFPLEHFIEDLTHGLYKAHDLQLSLTQVSVKYLPSICEKFSIGIPELYLKLDSITDNSCGVCGEKLT